jgi:hypothetical protein
MAGEENNIVLLTSVSVLTVAYHQYYCPRPHTGVCVYIDTHTHTLIYVYVCVCVCHNVWRFWQEAC